MLSEEYIDLCRTFHELTLKDGAADEFDFQHLRHGKSLSWSDLLARHRTVILSEAGSGKTEEIRQTATSLRREGKAAFFLRLEHVADDFEIAFEEGDLDAFESWLASNSEGWLFLDSVDEARLREPKDFERAIRKIGLRISAALQRTHIVLTSRGTAWRPVTDLRLCQQHLKYVEPEPAEEESTSKRESDTGPFRIVALNDLRSDQVQIFAEAKGVTNAESFLNAIERADAWSMAARPDDLAELVEFWVTHKRIGNRLELMRSSIARRLVERDQGRREAAPLSLDDAHIGARSVAAAATMAQESTIRVPDGTENAKGIWVGSVLHGWDDKKCATLLSRPIFDEAIYGSVRFHHRTVREYLTAEWFKGLLNRETSRRNIESIFFREQYGQEVIVPAMRPVLVWLILLDDKIRERALAISPELIFEGGEPKALPVATRQIILREVCDTMDTGVIRGTTSDYRAVQRFADKDIVGDVKVLFQRYRSKADLQWFLLRMIWQGELVEGLPEAKEVALDPRAARFARVAAFRAIRAIGSEADNVQVRDAFLKEASSLNREWFAELLEELPATAQSVEWVLACLGKLKPKDPHTVDGVSQGLIGFIQALGSDLLSTLVDGMNALIGRWPVIERRFCEVSKRHGWLIKSAAQAAERLIVARHHSALRDSVLSVLQKLPTAQAHSDWELREIGSEIPKLVPNWSELNRALFWYEVAQARRYREKKKKERVTDYWQVSIFGSYWSFEADDFDWILSKVRTQRARDDRLVALSLAFRLYVHAGRPKKWREAMKAAVAGSPALETALNTHLHPPPKTAEQKKWKKREAEYQRRSAERTATQAKYAEDVKADIAKHVELLRSGLANPTAISNHQWYLHEKMREFSRDSSHWTEGHWQPLEADFGPDVAKAFRDGVVAYWRRYTPRLRSEGKANNSTPHTVIFGLTGLSIDARETDNWPANLNVHEAEIAFRYAMDELNGFPEWLPSIYAKFPEQISSLLLREVDWNLRIETVKQETYYVLADLAWNGSWAWEGIKEGIYSRLQSREPKNLENLRHMLNIVHGAGISPDRIARLAEQRSSDRRLAHAARWYAVWVGAEPVKAIPALEERLKSIKRPAAQTSFAMQFVVQLLGGRRTEAKTSDAFRTTEHLKQLYTLMHDYIRERDDIHRAGKGVYSPGLRDDAQDARSQLFSLLKEIPGKDSYLALMDLAALHPEPSSRPWMAHHAKTKAEQDADLEPWSISQTLDFQSSLERTPANHRELFELAAMRFVDLKDNLEHGDSSVADILRKGATEETDMRKYIGDWLRERAQDRYIIPQEEELADAKKMDLRIHGKGDFDGPVPVELKLAEKWSGPRLFERLENQLCGDYLRDSRSSRGLFVLVDRGNTRWQLPGSTKRVDFDGVVDALRAHWDAISPRFPNVDEIRVIGIDLTRRTDRKGV